MKRSAFPESGRFYKGNLHAHTTLSDGKMSPTACRDAYRAKGYDFLALTDHRVYGVHENLQLDDFLIVPGAELDIGFSPSCHHIVAIGGPDSLYKHGQTFERPKFAGVHTAQRMIDEINAANNLALYAHPRWSRVMLTDIAPLTDFWGMEVMNWGCEIEDHTGDSEMYLDQLWWQGKHFFVAGTDDWHGAQLDADGAFVAVKAEDLTLASVFEALKAGHFYASTGPEIHAAEVDGTELRVACSPCRAVHICAYPSHTVSQWAQGAPLTEAVFSLPDGILFVRVQCVDPRGMSAWSQPFFLEP